MRKSHQMDAMSTVSTYQYTSLPPGHIRLVYLKSISSACKDPGSVTCSIKTVLFLDTQPVQAMSGKNFEYEALSYAWGSLSETFPVLCDGKVMRVHWNLYEALPYLTTRNSTLPLWIDAISIDQANEAEKVEQIGLMTDIYRSAVRVWAWLGVAGEPGGQEAVERILPRAKAAGDKFQHLADGVSLIPEELGLPDLDSHAWTAFCNLINNPWFFRLWVVQEVAVAQQLLFLYGVHQIDLEVLAPAFRSAPRLAFLRDQHGNNFPNYHRLRTRSWLLFSCREVYQTCAHAGTLASAILGLSCVFKYTVSYYHCHDPKDRVRALLGLASGKGVSNIYMDETTSVVDLYTQFFHVLVTGREHIDDIWEVMLSLAVETSNRGQGLPSWCPDLHANCDIFDHRQLNIDEKSLCASERRENIQKGRSNSELLVRGTVVDSVEDVCEVFHAPTPRCMVSWLHYAAYFLTWEHGASSLAKSLSGNEDLDDGSGGASHHTRGSLISDYWLTLIAEDEKQITGNLRLEDFQSLKSDLSSLLQFVQDYGVEKVVREFIIHDGSSQTEVQPDRERQTFLRHMSKFVVNNSIANTPNNCVMLAINTVQEGCQFFRTKGRRLGFARGRLKPGDQVVVFDGASKVHIIRERSRTLPVSEYAEDFRTKHELVAVAYLRGMMHGEVETLSLNSQDIILV